MFAYFFFVLMLYIKFQVPSSSGSLVLQPPIGIKDRRTEGRTDGWAKSICPLNFFEVGGIKIGTSKINTVFVLKMKQFDFSIQYINASKGCIWNGKQCRP